jgi:menaquinone-dependent protoporphyrinogen oxidase
LGHEVDVACPDDVTSLESYDAVVLGSAVYAGHWIDSAKRLANRIAECNPRPETWLFSSGLIGSPERPAESGVDLSDIFRATGANEHRVFGGRIDKSKLSLSELAILVAVRAGEGDDRDWDEITDWSADIAQRLVVAMGRPPAMAS